ncbi:MAG: D-lyxose ketol-isomerase [Chloroflexi bacterium OLB15]|nr:MAG: D-lyxose ketol-isomerase [Chloroflexi bacterium OLB15]
MKRSEINHIMREADAFVRDCGLLLPPFAYWTPEEWMTKGHEVVEIVRNGLGWDITDWGKGDFASAGLFLFTVRNGHPENLRSGKGKLYAEKFLVVEPGQVTPLHFHWNKVEDFINRGGGLLVMELYNSTPTGELDDSDVTVSVDGVLRNLKAGEQITLTPGESITLPVEVYHKFWGAEKRVLVGEISNVNDDNNDNRFYEDVGRFPQIEEDEAPLHLLVNDYARYYRGGM